MLCFWQVLLGCPPEAQGHISLSSGKRTPRGKFGKHCSKPMTREPQTSEIREEKREKTITAGGKLTMLVSCFEVNIMVTRREGY